MGLERISAVMQGVHSNYQIDLFANLIAAAAKALRVRNDGSSSLNVIADHIRASSFLVVDGVLPGNEGRRYVLRRIIRRAIRHGKKLGVTGSFFYKLVKPLCNEMGEAYPELLKARAHVEKVLRTEEDRFAETLDQGIEILEDAIAAMKGTVIPGDVVFRLYDTYGFPVDLTADIARERGLTIDEKGFESLMSVQRDRARAASKFGAAESASIQTDVSSDFSGYGGTEGQSRVVAIFKDGKSVESLSGGNDAAVVLQTTPFYAESGGQVGDTGVLKSTNGTFVVSDTQKSGNAILHFGKVQSGILKSNDAVHAIVDAERRHATVLNHSATHLLHAALRNVLGEHVTQKGSLVAPDRLRFDFSHYEGLSAEQLQAIETLVNDEIRKNTAAETKHMHYNDAVASGAIALFGEKYGDEVRVLRLGDFSVELCGGTHVSRAGDIGLFKIVSESGVASGVRRIEALTGKTALRWIDAIERSLDAVASLLKSQRDQVVPKVEQLIRRSRELEKELAATRQQLLTGGSSRSAENIVEIDGIKVLAARMDGADAKTLRDAVDRFKDQLQSAVIVLGSIDDGKVRLAAGVTRNNIERIQAGDVIRPVAAQVGGKGGGRPDFAQAGGSNPLALDAALASVPGWVTEHLR
jgi:alanyl-tRNA synthetase